MEKGTNFHKNVQSGRIPGCHVVEFSICHSRTIRQKGQVLIWASPYFESPQFPMHPAGIILN